MANAVQVHGAPSVFVDVFQFTDAVMCVCVWQQLPLTLSCYSIHVGIHVFRSSSPDLVVEPNYAYGDS